MKKEGQIRYALDLLIGQGNLEVVGTIFTADYIAHAGDKNYQGHAFLKRWTKELRSAIPNIKAQKVEFLAQKGNTITWQRTLRGKHEKNLRGIPASGKTITFREMVVSRFEGHKIAEEWVVSELAGQLMSKQPKNS